MHSKLIQWEIIFLNTKRDKNYLLLRGEPPTPQFHQLWCSNFSWIKFKLFKRKALEMWCWRKNDGRTVERTPANGHGLKTDGRSDQQEIHVFRTRDEDQCSGAGLESDGGRERWKGPLQIERCPSSLNEVGCHTRSARSWHSVLCLSSAEVRT